MTTIDLTKSIIDNGGKVGNISEMISDFAGSYREPLENTYLAGGNAHIPEDMEFFADPVKNAAGEEVLNVRTGEPVIIRGFYVQQDGQTVKLCIGTLQKRAAAYTEQGTRKLDSNGNGVFVETTGTLVAKYKETCAANTAEAFETFFNDIKGKDLRVKSIRHWVKSFGSKDIVQAPFYQIDFV